MHKPSIVTLSSAQLEWHDMELGMFFHFDLPINRDGVAIWLNLISSVQRE